MLMKERYEIRIHGLLGPLLRSKFGSMACETLPSQSTIRGRIEPITLVRLLDKLEAAGLVERRPDPADRRVRRLFLTEATGPLLEQLQGLASETREAALAGLTDAERQQLTDLLMKVRGNLSSKPSAPETSEDDSAPEVRTANHA